MKFTKASLAKTAALLLCSTVLFCGCVKNDEVVIKVNGHEITKAQYWEDFNRIKNVQLKGAPKEVKKETSYAMLSLKERYTNDVILRELLEEEFVKRKIEATEDEIKEKQKAVIAQIGSEEQFRTILKENNISDKKLHDDIAQEVKMDKLINALNIKEASDSDAQSFYNKNKATFDMPERARVSHILIQTNSEEIKRKITDADKKAALSTDEIDKKVKEEVARKEALANEVLAKAKANPNDFAKLAKEYSEDETSAKNGGDIGFVSRDTVVKEFGDAAFSQKVGVVGPLVTTQFGKHIILVKDKSAAGLQPFDKVKNDIKTFLTQQKKITEVQKYLNGLKSTAKVEFLDESLDPKNIEKQLDEALKKEIERQQKANVPKSKQKTLEKMENEK